MASLLQENLEFLTQHASLNTLESLNHANVDDSDIYLESDRIHNSVYRIKTESNKVFMLHSKRDPVSEADHQIRNWTNEGAVDWAGLIVVFGVAGCYHLQQLARNVLSGGMLVVLDNNPPSVKFVLQYHELSKLIPSGTTSCFIINSDSTLIAREYRMILSKRNNFTFSFFTHPGLRRACSEKLNVLSEKIIVETRLDGMDRGTLASFSDEWTQNTILNLPTILNNPGVHSLKNKFKNLPAIVVTAGPSLNHALKTLKDAKGKALIIAVGTALKPLLAAGIKPDFVIAIDSDPKTWNQFSDIESKDIYLLAGTIVYPPIFKLFNDHLFSFMSDVLTDFNDWLISCDSSPGNLAVGGTVAVSAIDAAVVMGCSPIILLGLDLSFPEDGTSHAKNSMYDGHYYSKDTLVKVAGNNGNDVWTTKQFSMYIEIMNSYLEDIKNNTSIDIINANQQGALIKNSTQVNPNEIARFLLDDQKELLKQIDTIHNSSDKPALLSTKKAYNNANLELIKMEEIAHKAVIVSDSLLSNPVDVARKECLIKKLDNLDSKLKKQKVAGQLLTSAIKAVNMHIQSYRIETDTTHDQHDLFVDVVSKSKQYYQQIEGAASWIRGLLEDAADQYQIEYSQRNGGVINYG